MTDIIELAKQAGFPIEVLSESNIAKLIKFAGLVVQQQVNSEPVAWIGFDDRNTECIYLGLEKDADYECVPLYTTPQPDRVAELEADKAKMIEVLDKVQLVCCFGGLVDLSQGDALALVRKLTLQYHDNALDSKEAKIKLETLLAEMKESE